MTLNMSAPRYPVSLVDVCLLIPAGVDADSSQGAFTGPCRPCLTALNG